MASIQQGHRQHLFPFKLRVSQQRVGADSVFKTLPRPASSRLREDRGRLHPAEAIQHCGVIRGPLVQHLR